MKINKKIAYVIFSLFLLLNLEAKPNKKKSTEYSHIIVLKDGSEYRGKLLKIDQKRVYFETINEKKEWDKTEIARIQFHQKRLYENIDKINQIKDKDIKSIWSSSKKWKPSKNRQAVLLFDKINITFMEDSQVSIKTKRAIKVLNEDGKNYSTDFVYYFDDALSAKLLYGITILPNGRVAPIDEAAINNEPVNNSTPHYDRLRRIKFGLKDVDIGSVLIWESEVIREWDSIRNPVFLKKQLVDTMPIEKRIIEIDYPSNQKINYKLYKGLIPFDEPKIEIKESNGRTTYKLEQKKVEEYIVDEDSAPSNDIVYPAFYAAPDTSWTSLGKTYYDLAFAKPMPKTIQKKASSIIEKYTKKKSKKKKKKKITAEKKLELIYEYINRKIDTSSVSMHSYSFLPSDEEKLLELPSLNTLDKSYLFARMAESLEMPVKLIFYRGNFRNDIINECPSFRQFDSVVCQAMVDEKPTYFSFENENFNVGQTGYSISKAWALKISDASNSIITLNEIAPDYNRHEYDYNCTLSEDNTLTLKRKMTIFGSAQAGWRAKRFLSDEELDKFMKSRVNSLANDIELIDYKFTNKLDDFDKPVIVEETIKINNFSFSSGDTMKLLKLPGVEISAGSVNKINRKLPYDVGSTYQDTFDLSLSFPDKYKPVYMPEQITSEHDGFYFSYTYSTKKNRILLTIKSGHKKKIIPVEQYTEFKKLLESGANKINEWILLEAAK